MNIYVTDEQTNRMKLFHKTLSEQGVPLTDNRGNFSDSRLIRELIRLTDPVRLGELLKAEGQPHDQTD